MRNGLWKSTVVLFLVLAVFAAGSACSKKQTVKSDDAIGTETHLQTPADQEPGVAVRQADPGVAVTQEKASLFADARFDFDKYDLTPQGKDAARAVANYMLKNPKARVLIEGHADIRGTAEYNMALGERRATSVKNYLISLGVPEASLSTISFGKERPLDPGLTEEAHARNRRAHFVVK